MLDNQSKKQASDQRTIRRHYESSTSMVKKPMDFVDRALRCRHEMKYLISGIKAEAITQFIKPYIQMDRYSKLQRGGFYPIVSLYLDSDDFGLCRESLTGQKNRFKLRIRSYTDELDYPRFFEIKRRITNIILKSRARVMDRDVPALLAGLSLPPQSYTTDENVLNQFQLYMKTIGAKPVILVRYMRQAFEGDSEDRIRITLDKDLCCKVVTTPEVRLDGSHWQRSNLTIGNVILEIKFTVSYPAWLSRMVGYFDLKQRSISKYATSVKQSCELGFCAPILKQSG